MVVCSPGLIVGRRIAEEWRIKHLLMACKFLFE